MYGFQSINTNGDTVVLDRANTFYYLGQASVFSTDLAPAFFTDVRSSRVTYQITSPNGYPLPFIENINGQRMTIQSLYLVSGTTYRFIIEMNSTTIPRAFCFGQTNPTTISNPTDYSMVLYDSAGQITFDGTRDLLYDPAIAVWTGPSTANTGTQITIQLNGMNALSVSGTVPSSSATLMAANALVITRTFDSINLQFVTASFAGGIYKSGGILYSCWVKETATAPGGSSGVGQYNVGLSQNIQVIDIARYT
jgi:hypothetical protein